LKIGKKLSAILLIAAILLPLLLSGNTLALSGTANYSPLESNLSVKRWVTASASSNSADAKNALDGNAATVWLPDETDDAKWFMIDLDGGYYAVRKTEVTFPSATSIYKYILEGSKDGVIWATLADRSENDRYAAGFTDVFSYPGIRYIKLTFLSDVNIGIKDIRVVNYIRDNMTNGSDMSELGSQNTRAYYYNANNSPVQPGVRGGVLYRANPPYDPTLGNNIFGLLKDCGWGVNRLRIWNNPSSPGSATSCSPAQTYALAPYVTGSGLELAIDFHYSDTWADPQHQQKPAAWVRMSFDDMVTALNKFTYDTIKVLIEQGTAPTIVAIGNEVSAGFCWGKEWRDVPGANNSPAPSGWDTEFGGGIIWKYWHEDEVTPAQYQQYLDSMQRCARLLDAGIKAIRQLNTEYGLSIETEIHCAFNVVEGNVNTPVPDSEKTPRVREFATQISRRLAELGSYSDRFGISYYPDWHGSWIQLEDNIEVLREIMPYTKFNISECSPRNSGRTPTDPNVPSGWQPTVQSQGDDFAKLMQIMCDIPDNKGQGVWSWGGTGSYQYGPVNFTTTSPYQPYASIKAFKDTIATNAVESGIYVTTKAGTAPALPATVKNVDAKTGVITSVPVAWAAVAPSSYASPGTFEVTGTATTGGNMNGVRAYVSVSGEPSFSVNLTQDLLGGATGVFTIDNTFGQVDVSALCLIASYNERGILVDTASSIISVRAGAADAETIQFPAQPTGYKMKGFLWDAVTLVPLCEAKSATQFIPVIENPSDVATDYRYRQYFNPIIVQPIPELEGREDDFICGVDLSSLWVVVNCGGQYFDQSGKKLIQGDEISNALAIMKKYGLNWVRVRLWNDITPFPSGMQDSQGQGGQNDLKNTLEIAKKAHDLGLKVLLDFHYSDTWADPGRQIKPRAWSNIATMAELETTLYDFTKESLEAFLDAGFMPEMVQIGNENNNGFLYHEMTPAGTGWQNVTGGRPSGSSSANGGAGYITLLKAGIKAVRDVDPNNSDPAKRTKVMVHLADGNNTTMFTTRATLLRNNDVDYDVMGASYYPFWHGTIAQITNTLNSVANTYGKEVAIAETGWGFDTTIPTAMRPYSTGPSLSTQFGASQANTHPEWAASPQGQADALRAICEVVAKVPNNRGLGVFVWESAWIPTPQMGSGWAAGSSAIVVANQAHFDYYGRALPSCNIWARLFPAYNVGTPTPVIVSLAPTTAATVVGFAPTLPATVTATYSDNSTRSLPVTWGSVSPSQYAAIGTFTVTGTVEGTVLAASCVVTVSADLITGNLLLRGNPRNSYFDSTTGTSNYNGTGWVVPSQWGSPATSTSESRSAGIAGHAQMALKYWINAAPNSSSLRAYLTVTPSVVNMASLPAGQYRIDCYARSGSTSTGQYFQLFGTVGSSTQTLNIANTNTWTLRSVTITVPAGTSSFDIGIQVTSTGVGTGAWGQFDDFAVTYLG